MAGDDTTEYSEVNHTVAAEATQGQPTYLNIPTKDTVGSIRKSVYTDTPNISWTGRMTRQLPGV